MITFLDGPAQGQVLLLRRSPILLRVVRSGKLWDALDQLGDTVEVGEEVYLYQLASLPSRFHLRAGRKLGGYYVSGSYRLLPTRHWPTDDILRDEKKWAAWCDAHQALLTPEWAVDYLERQRE